MLEGLLKGKSDRTAIQLIRYGFVGGGAYAVDFTALYVLTEYLDIHYLISAALGFMLGLVTNYLLSIFWVFPTRSLSDRKMEFAVFAVIGAVGLGLNELFIWFFTENTHLHYLISKVISTVLVFFWNFFARKKLLFS